MSAEGLSEIALLPRGVVTSSGQVGQPDQLPNGLILISSILDTL